MSCDMSPDHLECKVCGGCAAISCTCACRLAAEREAQELVSLEMGLRNFPGPETPCPKCNSEMPRIEFHEYVTISLGEEEAPCAAWAREGLLTGPVTEHLCVRCNRCGYGYPAKTADSS